MNSSSKLSPHTMTSPATSAGRHPRGRRMLLSLLLCLALLFATASTPVFSNGDVENTEDWRGYITVDKEAVEPAPTEGPREADVTLTVTGTAPEPILDVVLVLDVSKSMDERAGKGQPSRLESLISAATGFVDTVLPSGSNNRVAVVVYGTRAGFFGDLSNPFFTDADDVNDLIEDIESDAYTNMHEGMLVANGIMEHHARSDANKIIVFMSDGVPNRYMLGLILHRNILQLDYCQTT